MLIVIHASYFMALKNNIIMLSSYTPALAILVLSIVCLWAATPNFVLWLLLAEIFWIGLYLFYASLSAHLDSLNIAIWCLFILCLATSESAIGLSLLIFNFIKAGNIHGAQLNKKTFKPLGAQLNSTWR